MLNSASGLLIPEPKIQVYLFKIQTKKLNKYKYILKLCYVANSVFRHKNVANNEITHNSAECLNFLFCSP